MARTPRSCAVDACERPVRTGSLCNMHYQRKWKHGDASARKSNANGEGGVSAQGYRIITVDGRRVAEHIHLCEQAIGKPLPDGTEVHHVNEIKTDNRPENLVICKNAAYHQLLHARTKAMEQCGDPSKRQCNICRTWDDPTNLYIPKLGQAGYHHACRRERRRLHANG